MLDVRFYMMIDRAYPSNSKGIEQEKPRQRRDDDNET